MAELKTKANSASVAQFLDALPDPKQREDCDRLLQLMQSVTKEKPTMWGSNLVGFGSYHYKYASGHEGDFFLTGFSPRKSNLTIHVMSGFTPFEGLLKKLGKHKLGKSCLYLKRLDDADPAVLETLIRESVALVKKTYPS